MASVLEDTRKQTLKNSSSSVQVKTKAHVVYYVIEIKRNSSEKTHTLNTGIIRVPRNWIRANVLSPALPYTISAGHNRHDDGIQQHTGQHNAETSCCISSRCPRLMRFISVRLLKEYNKNALFILVDTDREKHWPWPMPTSSQLRDTF